MAYITGSGIGSGQQIKADHILRIINALNGSEPVDILLDGSMTATSFSGNGAGLTNVTASSTISSSYATTSSYAVTSSHAFSAVTSSYVISSSYATTSSYAVTSSHAFNVNVSYVIVSSSYTVTSADDIIEITSGSIFQLPSAAGNRTKRFTFINVSTGSITILASGSDTIGNTNSSGSSSLVVFSQDAPTLISNNLNWRII